MIVITYSTKVPGLRATLHSVYPSATRPADKPEIADNQNSTKTKTRNVKAEDNSTIEHNSTVDNTKRSSAPTPIPNATPNVIATPNNNNNTANNNSNSNLRNILNDEANSMSTNTITLNISNPVSPSPAFNNQSKDSDDESGMLYYNIPI